MTEDLIFFPEQGYARLRNGLSEKDKGLSIGRLITEAKIPWLAVMNVSLLPLQKNAYKDHAEEHSDKMQTLWRSFCEIREKIKTGDPLDPVSQGVYDVIVDDLAWRVERILGHELRFIPFGNVARRSLSRAQQAQNGLLQDLSVSGVGVAHPSWWRRDGRPNPKYTDRNRDLHGVASKIVTHLS